MRIISGTAKRLQIKTPASELRPTMDKVRAAVYSTLELGLHLDLKTARVLDLFAGSGAYGLEALSRGAPQCEFVEREREAQECIKKNIKAMRMETRGRLYPQDVFAWLNQFAKDRPGGEGVYDLVIADPPYERPHQPNRRAPRKVDVSLDDPDHVPPPPEPEPAPAEPDSVTRLLAGPWDRLLTTHGLLVLEQAIERPVEESPGLDLLRFRRYGKTVVVYYALPGAYTVKGQEQGESADA